MAGRKSHDKGRRNERKVVQLLREAGLIAYRVPLSGSSQGFPHDVVVENGPFGSKLPLEVKARKHIADFMFPEPSIPRVLIADRKEPVVVLDWKTFTAWLQALQHAAEDKEWSSQPSPSATS